MRTTSNQPLTQVSFRRLTVEDAPSLARLLAEAPPAYSQHFRPFAFDDGTIRSHLQRARRDLFLGVEVLDADTAELVGFYMLRGFDEGYADPMYGVFIGYPNRGRGLAHLTLAHAECLCRLNHCDRLLLKVHPDNVRARQLYESLGFVFLRTDSANDNLVLGKDMNPGNGQRAAAPPASTVIPRKAG